MYSILYLNSRKEKFHSDSLGYPQCREGERERYPYFMFLYVAELVDLHIKITFYDLSTFFYEIIEFARKIFSDISSERKSI
jgi:hypothetical protein